jgi:hypothetical protein
MSEDPFALSGVLGRDYVRELCQPARYSARHLVFQISAKYQQAGVFFMLVTKSLK